MSLPEILNYVRTGKYSSGLSEVQKRKIRRNAPSYNFANGKFWRRAEADPSSPRTQSDPSESAGNADTSPSSSGDSRPREVIADRDAQHQILERVHGGPWWSWWRHKLQCVYMERAGINGIKKRAEAEEEEEEEEEEGEEEEEEKKKKKRRRKWRPLYEKKGAWRAQEIISCIDAYIDNSNIYKYMEKNSQAKGFHDRMRELLRLPKGCTENLMKNLGREFREKINGSKVSGAATTTPKLRGFPDLYLKYEEYQQLYFPAGGQI